MTFDELCQLEPRLRELEEQARSLHDDGSRSFFCSNFAWLPMNAELRALLGVARIAQPGDAERALLRDSRAYELAFEHLSAELPPCRGCGCRRFQPLRDLQQE